MSARETIIYGIREVGSDRILYVGATVDLEKRRSVGYQARAVAAALKGIEWEYLVLERCADGEAPAREAHWIARLSAEGHKLANVMKRAKAVAPASRGGISASPSDAYYRTLDQHPLRVRLPADVMAMLDEMVSRRDDGDRTKVAAVIDAIRLAHRSSSDTP